MEYDVSGKVKRVLVRTAQGGLDGADQEITAFAYDDRGFRILKRTGAREEWYVRDASGNIMSIYQRDVEMNDLAPIEYPIYGSGKIGTAFRQPDHLNYNYELTDHLGNVRATVSGLQFMAVATMELSNHEWEAQYFDNLEATRNSTVAMSHNSSGSSALLSGPSIGPALTAQVKGGSELTLKVWGRYIEPQSTLNNAAMGGALGGLLSGSLDGAVGGEGSPVAPANAIDVALALMSGVSTEEPTVPKAYPLIAQVFQRGMRVGRTCAYL